MLPSLNPIAHETTQTIATCPSVLKKLQKVNSYFVIIEQVQWNKQLHKPVPATQGDASLSPENVLGSHVSV